MEIIQKDVYKMMVGLQIGREYRKALELGRVMGLAPDEAVGILRETTDTLNESICAALKADEVIKEATKNAKQG